MATSTCQHGITGTGCSYCATSARTATKSTASSPTNGRARQRLLDELCDRLGVARHAETPGSSPARVFAAAAEAANVPSQSMPKIGAAIAAKAGLEWGPGCDNRGHHFEATRVTAEGISTVRDALAILAARRRQPPANSTS